MHKVRQVQDNPPKWVIDCLESQLFKNTDWADVIEKECPTQDEIMAGHGVPFFKFIVNGKCIGRPFWLQTFVNVFSSSMPVRGVYWLFSEMELVYIGISNNIKSRINNHIQDGFKDFDAVMVTEFEGTDKQLMEYEAMLIKKMNPKYNIRHAQTTTQ